MTIKGSATVLGATVTTTPGTPGEPGICDCGITDTFTRSGSGWGMADNGNSWTPFSSGTTSASTDGSRAAVVNTTAGSNHSETLVVTTPPADWDGLFSFWVDAVPNGTTGTLVYVDLYDPGGTWQAELDIMVSSGGPSATYQGEVWFWYYQDTYTAKVDWVANTEYKVRIHRDYAGTTWAARVWKASEAEPTGWLATQILDNGGVATTGKWEMGVHVYGAGGGGRTTYFDNLDITGVDRCSAVQFDDFNRTVAAGGWGISTSGLAWTTPTYGASYLSVNGSQGVCTFPSLGYASDANAISTAGVGGIAPWVGTTCTMTTSFTVSSIGTLPEYCAISWYFTRAGYQTQFGFQIENSSGNIYGKSGTDSAGEFYLAKRNWAANVAYNVKIEFYPSDHMSLKLWLASEAEPSIWTGTILDTQGPIIDGTASSTFRVEHFGRGVRSIKTEYIEFDYTGKPCYEL